MGAAWDSPKDFVDKRTLFAGRSLSVREVESLLEETIRARDEQIAVWCETKAATGIAAAERHDAQIGVPPGCYDVEHHDLRERYMGQASAFLAIAAALRGAK